MELEDSSPPRRCHLEAEIVSKTSGINTVCSLSLLCLLLVCWCAEVDNKGPRSNDS
ncbi:hypothetical protein COLO4_19661 [Corchorus olitorius]|uniref:Uncharacterized protein n=1 Tax=Corchorus olitorius TaxID=93759 RepID=A0A1R3J470_9ROSI|nr:hypothetical protein COLO4_19661 [Corchorus olitorius]